MYYRNRTSGEKFKLKICAWAQSIALGTRTKFQLEILTINVISGIVYFQEIISESSRNLSETTPRLLICISTLCRFFRAKITTYFFFIQWKFIDLNFTGRFNEIIYQSPFPGQATYNVEHFSIKCMKWLQWLSLCFLGAFLWIELSQREFHPGYTYQEVSPLSLEACRRRCEGMTPSCKAFNYDHQFSVCTLHNTSWGDPGLYDLRVSSTAGYYYHCSDGGMCMHRGLVHVSRLIYRCLWQY